MAPSSSDITLPTDGGTSSGTRTYANTEESDLERKDKIECARADIEEQLTDLARKLTTRSEKCYHRSPFEGVEGGCLDPNSPQFKARDWAKAFYNARYNADEGCLPRIAGVAFKNLNVSGYGSPVDYQMSVGNALLKLPAMIYQSVSGSKRKINILQGLDGLVLPGEQLCVLGPPGSGCTTFLKTIAGETHGFQVDPAAYINYHGITSKRMSADFRGEAIYTAEVDTHYPMLSVGDTLYFAALARAPHHIPGGISSKEYAIHLRNVIMAVFGISHTINTRVGNDFVRGVSGGERKRVTIAEAALSYAPLQCWDNSTRGLDSANAVEFCRTLRMQSDVFGMTSCVAIYQAPQAAYNVSLGYCGQALLDPANRKASFSTKSLFYMKDIRYILVRHKMPSATLSELVFSVRSLKQLLTSSRRCPVQLNASSDQVSRTWHQGLLKSLLRRGKRALSAKLCCVKSISTLLNIPLTKPTLTDLPCLEIQKSQKANDRNHHTLCHTGVKFAFACGENGSDSGMIPVLLLPC
jgi:ABC-type multidrug transport system ATPase subunit